jgi:uncharacterized SAM-binding protein YcdF (DUF218 family)
MTMVTFPLIIIIIAMVMMAAGLILLLGGIGLLFWALWIRWYVAPSRRAAQAAAADGPPGSVQQ